MVLKAWTLSCNYELKSSSGGPQFFLIYLDVKKIIFRPKSISIVEYLESYYFQSKVHSRLGWQLITFNVIFSYETFVCMHIFIKRHKINFYEYLGTSSFSYVKCYWLVSIAFTFEMRFLSDTSFNVIGF